MRHALEHFLQSIPDQGGWLANTGYKPRFVQQCLDRFAGRPVLYLDASAEVRRYPKLFESYREPGSCDLAVHVRFRQNREADLMSGTIYLANTPACTRVVAQWVNEQEHNPRIWDQRNLQTVIERLRDTIQLRYLPPSYCYIVGWSRPGKVPVIAHRIPPRRRRKRKAAPAGPNPN